MSRGVVVFPIVIMCLVAIFIITPKPRDCARNILLKRGYVWEDAENEIKKELEEILDVFPLDHDDIMKREMNLQIYRILINENKISEKANLFRVAGYELKEKDKILIKKINSQYSSKNR